MANVASRRKRIQTLFLHRVESYGLEEAARLLGITCKELIREAEDDHRPAYRSDGTWRFRWRQVAYIAFRTWTLAEIRDALGAKADTVLPPLMTLRAVTLKLPEYMLRAMELSAVDDDMTLDAWLSRELVDWAGTVADRMERRVRGFQRAYFYPGEVRAARRTTRPVKPITHPRA